MEKIFYNKLCRDRVPEIIRSKGFDCDVRVVEDQDEYRREIVRKVYEEASGVSDHTGREDLLKQLADLVITLDALTAEFGITDAELDAAVEASVTEKGAYDDHLYLSWSSDVEYRGSDRSHGFDD